MHRAAGSYFRCQRVNVDYTGRDIISWNNKVFRDILLFQGGLGSLFGRIWDQMDIILSDILSKNTNLVDETDFFGCGGGFDHAGQYLAG